MDQVWIGNFIVAKCTVVSFTGSTISFVCNMNGVVLDNTPCYNNSVTVDICLNNLSS